MNPRRLSAFAALLAGWLAAAPLAARAAEKRPCPSPLVADMHGICRSAADAAKHDAAMRGYSLEEAGSRAVDGKVTKAVQRVGDLKEVSHAHPGEGPGDTGAEVAPAEAGSGQAEPGAPGAQAITRQEGGVQEEGLTVEQLLAEQTKFSGQYPSPWDQVRIKGFFDKKMAGKIKEEDVAEFGRYMGPRSQTAALYYRYRKPGDPKPSDLEDMGDEELQAHMGKLKERMAPQDWEKFLALRAQAEGPHNKLMESLGMHLMEVDKASRFFMVDPKAHDRGFVGAQGDTPDPWQYRSRQRLLNGDLQGALQDAEQAVSLDPNNAKSFALLASAQYDLKNFKAAVEAARAALRLDPSDATSQAVLRLAHEGAASGYSVPKLGAAESQESAARLAAGISLKPTLQAISPRRAQSARLARQGERQLNLGDVGAAVASASRAIEIDPQYARAYGVRGFAWGMARKLEAALDDADKGLSLDKAETLSLKAKAQALNRLGRYPEALAASRAASERDPRSYFGPYMEAVAQSGLNDRGGTLEAMRRAVELAPRLAPILDLVLQLPQDADVSLLFPKEKPQGAGAAARPAVARRWKLAGIVAAVAAGGGLLGLALLQLFGPAAAGLRSAFTRAPALAAPQAAAAAPGDALLRGQYRSLRQIGAGGMGMVFEGSDVSLDRRVAIKKMREELKLDRRQRERFITEAKLVAALHHPNIVDIYSILDEGDEIYLVFEFVAGKTLHQMISERGRMPFKDALAIFRGVAAALEYAHGRNIVHRDLKPSNIMIDQEGAAKVMDFGIARVAKDAATRHSMTNTVVGTPPYMAPEQEQGVVRKESDVFALAVCLYEMLCGKLPFSGSGAGMLMNKVNKTYVPASRVVAGLPEGVDGVFDKALDPDPDRRYRCAADLLRGLESLDAASQAV